METKDALSIFFDNVIEGLKEDAQSKNQKIPVSSFRHEQNAEGGKLYSADYFQYLIYGRSPGKFPPPEKMLDFVESTPDILARAKQQFQYITEQGLAYLIGRKLAKEGSDIYSGKKPGIDFLGVMEKNMPELLKQLAQGEALKFATELRSALQ